jgi:hypothetical protein
MTRFGFVITTYAATLFVALSSLVHPEPKLLWNASAVSRSASMRCGARLRCMSGS